MSTATVKRSSTYILDTLIRKVKNVYRDIFRKLLASGIAWLSVRACVMAWIPPINSPRVCGLELSGMTIH